MRDPITSRSLSGPIAVFSILLVLALAWALYDEAAGDRPWKDYQQRFARLYTDHLKRIAPASQLLEKQLQDSPDAHALSEQAKAAESAAAPAVAAIDRQISSVRRDLTAMQRPFQDARAQVAALTYQLDHTNTPQQKDAIRRNIETARRDGNPDHLQQVFDDLKAREVQLDLERAAATKTADGLRARWNDYVSAHRDGPSPRLVDGLLRKMSGFDVGIRQIYTEESGLVDRCESCHLGIRETIPLSAAEMGGQAVFASHPHPELLTIHDPAKFGCTPCHNGNGLAVSSVKQAHGNYEHWQWPLFSPANRESGCVQCHMQDRVLAQAPVLNRGREVFQLKGCAGCHRFEGFDREGDALATAGRQILVLSEQRKQAIDDRARETRLGDQSADDEATRKHYSSAKALLLKASEIDARLEALEIETRALQLDAKRAGPNLKEVRLKLRQEWLPAWLKDPLALNPGARMPRFRLNDSEVRALSAFLWQAAWTGPHPDAMKPGDATRGKDLFETRGCLSCHSIGEGANRTGGEFAVNLTRIGQKATYDYVVRWVHDPRQRSRPWCPREQRDLAAEDFARHGQPFVFDAKHSKCPNDGAELQVRNATVMPPLRLSWQESQDIATYLMGLTQPMAAAPDVSYMDDPALAETGRTLIGRYGCANCHEIRGFENARQSATELTKWASKPLEQLDFGLLEGQAKREGWYSYKGFIEHKLQNPAIYDRGREKARQDQLIMPDIQLTPDDLRAVTTFMLGSLDTPTAGEFRTIPASLRYNPAGAQRDIQDGWWLVKKYNCMGCHSFSSGQKAGLGELAHYQDPDFRDQLPPSLIGEGARVSPAWLARFLANPALDERQPERNGVRPYLQARMPSFGFSSNEIGILVRFFAALAGQQAVLTADSPAPPDERERRAARALFSSSGAPCLKCHVYGDPVHDRQASAPNLLLAGDRLKPGWTMRWLIDPQTIMPGTAMPSELFRRDGDRWVMAGAMPEGARNYAGDHAELLVRYMLAMTPEEQRRLIGMIKK